MKTIRIAMIGTGFVADFYMQGLADVPGQEVAVVVGREPSLARFAKKWGIAETSASLDAAIVRKDIDLYVIALANFLHKDAALKLAVAGKHQVCTKPLARNAAEARAMLEAVKKAGVLHGYAETEVFSPSVVRAERAIRSGAIGDVLWVRSREAHFGPHSPWFWDAELSGGGALLDMGCHCIEAARYFFGKGVKPIEVMAWGDTLYHKEKTKAEDNALAMIRFENGGLAHLEVSWTARGGLDLRNEVHGTKGAIFTDATRGTPIEMFALGEAGYLIEKADLDRGWVKPLPEEAFTYGYQAEMKHFVECIREGQMPRENYEDGFIVNAIMDACYRSMKSRRWERIEEWPEDSQT